MLLLLLTLGAVTAAPPGAIPTGPLPRAGVVYPCAGQLCLDGKPYPVRGINYFPGFQKQGTVFWLDPSVYNTNQIDDDLTAIIETNINTLIIQAQTTWSGQVFETSIADFLDRSAAHGLRVFLFFDACSPFGPVPAMCEDVIQRLGLATHPAVIGYDIQWEAHLGQAPQRAWLQPHWQAWIQDRFQGTMSAPPLPSDDQLCATAPSSVVALFRRFVEDYTGYIFGAQIARMRQVDPYHLMGFRNGYGGNGDSYVCSAFPLDLHSGALTIDYIAPEGYQLPVGNPSGIMDWGGFTVAYADVGKPIIWYEFGLSTLCLQCTQQQQDAKLAEQAQFLTNVVNMSDAKGASGMSAWWWVGERPKTNQDSEVSDYGLVYDYTWSPTSVDSHGEGARDGWLSLCANASVPYRLAVVEDDSTTDKYSCPAGTQPLGSFKPSPGAPGSPTAYGFDGRSIYSGWLSLCAPSGSPVGVYTSESGCPTGTQATASFMPQQVSPGAGSTACDPDGRCIANGWLLYCASSPGSADFSLTENGLSMSSRSCPAGTTAQGSFKPWVQPARKPSQAAYQTALAGFAPTPRNYVAAITVDVEQAAGRFVTYQNGVPVYAAETARVGGGLVAVRSPCYGTTSVAPGPCVGGATSSECPLRCLNADFYALWLATDANPTWVEISAAAGNIPGEGPVAFSLPSGATRVLWSAQVGNTGEAVWQAFNKGGVDSGVGIMVSGSNRTVSYVSTDVPYLTAYSFAPAGFAAGGGPFSVTFQMVNATGNSAVRFGPSYAISFS